VACRAHLGQVQQRYEEIRALGGEVLAVSFSRPEVLAKHIERFPTPFPLLGDPDLAAYRAFGLGRTPLWRLFTPRAIGRYLKILLAGYAPHRPYAGDDVLQLGGDFVLDRERRLRFIYRSVDPTDRPSLDDLIRAIRQVSGGFDSAGLRLVR
jgi:hypothetical protein